MLLTGRNPKILIVADKSRFFTDGEVPDISTIPHLIRESLKSADIALDFVAVQLINRDNEEHPEVHMALMNLKSTLEIVVPLGSDAVRYLLPDSGSVTKIAGQNFNKDYGTGDLRVVPNFDLGYVQRDAGRLGVFENIFKKINSETSLTKSKLPTKILEPYQFLEYIYRLKSYLDSGQMIGAIFDIETSNAYLNTSPKLLMEDPKEYITGFSVADPVERVGYYMTIYHPDIEKTYGRQYALERAAFATAQLRTFLKFIPFICHNSDFDLTVTCYKLGLDPQKDVRMVGDTLVMAYLLIGLDVKISFKLKDLTRYYFDIDEDWDHEITNEFAKLPRKNYLKRLVNIPKKTVEKYGALDSVATLMLWEMFLPELEKQGMMHIYKTLLTATTMFSNIYIRGLNIDTDLMEWLASTLETQEAWYQRTLHKSASVHKWRVMNAKPKRVAPNPAETSLSELDTPYQGAVNHLIQSGYTTFAHIMDTDPEVIKQTGVAPAELDEILFDAQMQISTHTFPTVGVRTASIKDIVYNPEYLGEKAEFLTEKGAPSFNKEAKLHLQRHGSTTEARSVGQICNLLTEIADLQSKYLNGIRKHSELYGVFKPSFTLVGTTTGRLAGDIHSFPSFSADIKGLFNSKWANQGGLVFAPDFSQIEVRVMAAFANENELRKAYEEGIDIHKFVASKAFNKAVEEISKVERGSAKAIVFGILYGKSMQGLASDLGITVEEAQKIQDSIFIAFPGMKTWIDKTIAILRDQGYVQNGFNRRRYLPGIKLDPNADRRNKWIVAEAERAGVNSPIQGTASDLTLECLIFIDKMVIQSGWQSDIMATVHDSMEIDCHPSEVIDLYRLCKYAGEVRPPIVYDWLNQMPIKLDCGFGPDWFGEFEDAVIEESENHILFHLEGREYPYNKLMPLLQLNEYFTTEVTDVEFEEMQTSDFDADRIYQGAIDLGRKVSFHLKMTKNLDKFQPLYDRGYVPFPTEPNFSAETLAIHNSYLN
ncbi:DNA polymerase I [Maribacter phage Molly_5]|uniref:DNA polymerase n=1 Tax=Maribacter phage Molly_1 TaxID=2745685 RepID=A0A8E4XVR6_9CAUD|nr:DNA polymerase [Maribacter phage Molly_1]QQO97399.1 DNA polymerase I [Maribacter phage Molly_1]QQO97799.1 DNA polymerase I [Maribacter phage Molly_3]QQO98001.1 DNA polymerase I [Maribacter phage Molly_4]QQO98201.1 DNA polymerase I [Maribacter phage Molly_5]